MISIKSGQILISSRLFYVVLQIFLSLCFLITAYFAFKHMQESNPWVLGDWMINYSGGFVRRGLLGHMALMVGGHDIQLAKGLVFFTQVICYGVFFFFGYKLLRASGDSVSYLLVIFSPFLFMFQINDFQGGFRKEILFFALLSLAAWFSTKQTPFSRRSQLVVFLCVYPILILTHEMLAVFLPLLLVAFRDVIHKVVASSKADLLLLILPVLINVGVFFAVLLFRGDAQVAASICDSLGDFCSSSIHDNGAISWLQYDFSYGNSQVRDNLITIDHLAKFLVLLALSIVSFFPLRERLVMLFRDGLVRLLVSASLLGTILVMAGAIDWGRLIYIWCVAFFVLTLTCEVPRTSSTLSSNKEVVTIRVSYLAVVAIYFLGWRLLHDCTVPTKFFLGRFVKLVMQLGGAY